MKLFSNPEHRGIAGMAAVVLLILIVMGVSSGYLEKWFNITWLSGPSLEEHFVYISDRSGTPELYAQKEGEQAVKLTNGANASDIPAVSPNAHRVIYVAAYGGSDSVYGIRGDGKGFIRLTEASGPKGSPQFSANGKELYYLASNKLYVSQPDGANVKFILPTREEQTAAIKQGHESPKYRKYAWEDQGSGILASREAMPDIEQLVYLPEPGDETVPLPLSPDMTERVSVSGIVAVPGTTAFIVSTNIGNNAMLSFIDLSKEKVLHLGLFSMSELGTPAVNSSGSKVVVSVLEKGATIKGHLLEFDVSGGTPRDVSEQYFEDISFFDESSTLLATEINLKTGEKNVVLVSIDSGDVKNITTDGKSYAAVYCPPSAKK